jgi:integrase
MIGSPRFQHGSLIRVKNKTTDDTWFLRFYEDVGGKRTYRKRKIGSVRRFPRKADAEKAVLALRAKINSEVRSPETVTELLAHYTKHELTIERKSFSTVEGHRNYIDRYISPKWGVCKLSEVRTVAVEQWLEALPLAPGSKTKIRNIMSAVYSHGIRHEWIAFNPISKVRCSAKRLREPDIVNPAEFQAILGKLQLRDRAILMLVASTGLRRSELIALRWSDVNLLTMQIAVTRSCVRNRFGKVKTEASGKPVALHGPVKDVLIEWRSESLFNQDEDFLFPSIRLDGKKPLSPDMILKKCIRPAVVLAGITGKIIGYHSFRHSLASNARLMGEDVKSTQALMRQSTARITMDVYTQVLPTETREASRRIFEMMLAPKTKGAEGQHPSALLDSQALPYVSINH